MDPTQPSPQARQVGPQGRLAVLTALVFGGWLGLFVAGGQIPQLHAPLSHSDLLSRADLLAIEGFGLHAIAGSLPAWLLTAATLLLLVARLLDRREQADASALAEHLKRALPDEPVVAKGDHVIVGHGRRGRALVALAGGVAIVALALVGVHPAAIVAETDPDGTLLSGHIEAGRWVRDSAISGRCSGAETGLRCTIAGAPGSGLSAGEVLLAIGRPAALADRVVTWVASAPSPVANRGRMRWHRPAEPAWYAFDLPVGAAVQVPSLKARAALIDGGRAGPVVALSTPAAAWIAAAPGVASGPPLVRLAPPSRARIRIDTPLPAAPWIVAALLAVVGLGLAWRDTWAVVHVGPAGARVVAGDQPEIRDAVATWQAAS